MSQPQSLKQNFEQPQKAQPIEYSVKDKRILEQVDMMLNHTSNVTGFDESISDTFRIYGNILLNTGNVSRSFKKSLDQSRECFEDKSLLYQRLNELKNEKKIHF